jgi:lipoic acid synthetase
VKPDWLKINLGGGENYAKVGRIVREHKLHTICSSGKCPNIGQCWNAGTATFMILGDVCTRACKFCATKTGKPLAPDPQEPQRVAESVHLMELRYCVITSVDRDDLPDRGAAHWAQTIAAIREKNPHTAIEVLIPDFDADTKLLDVVIAATPAVMGHNIETVKRLTPQTRSRASYGKSLKVLRYLAQCGVTAKSGLMVGLGETPQEVINTMRDVRNAGVQLFTIGQYLQPTKQHLAVAEYITPQQFFAYKKIGIEMGFRNIASAPLVRSSYMAEQLTIHNS